MSVHHDALVVDLHMDTPTASLLDPEFELGAENATGHVDLPRLREGGVDAAFFVAWVEPWWAEESNSAFRRARSVLQETRRQVAATPGMRLARTGREIREARSAGDTAILLAVEGGHAISASLEKLHALAELGTRYMTLTWNHPNRWADACCSPPEHGGLSAFGREVIREMESVGVIPDLSHAADSTFWDVLEVASGPLLVTHSCARALVDHPRNVTDEMARALADHGGVIGVNFYPGFVDAEFARAVKERWTGSESDQEIRAILDPGRTAEDPVERYREYRRLRDEMAGRLGELPPAPLEALVRQILHLVEVAGVDHVALGSDFDGVAALPEGLDDVSRLPVLSGALEHRGLAGEELEKLLGENVLRLLDR